MNDWNRAIVDEFRANAGKVGGMFAGAPMLLLNSTGAKSGKPYTTPLVYLGDADRWVIFASKAGASTNPDWYYNLVAHKTAEIEVGVDKIKVNAEEVKGAERDRLFRTQATMMPNFAEYEKKTTRLIPVVALTRAS